jgi:hypothetical protein
LEIRKNPVGECGTIAQADYRFFIRIQRSGLNVIRNAWVRRVQADF